MKLANLLTLVKNFICASKRAEEAEDATATSVIAGEVVGEKVNLSAAIAERVRRARELVSAAKDELGVTISDGTKVLMSEIQDGRRWVQSMAAYWISKGWTPEDGFSETKYDEYLGDYIYGANFEFINDDEKLTGNSMRYSRLGPVGRELFGSAANTRPIPGESFDEILEIIGAVSDAACLIRSWTCFNGDYLGWHTREMPWDTIELRGLKTCGMSNNHGCVPLASLINAYNRLVSAA